MGRLDSLDMSVFQTKEGREWASRMLDYDLAVSMGEGDPAVYSDVKDAIAEDPWRLSREVVSTGDGAIHLVDFFLNVLSRVPPSYIKEYETLRMFVRRFGHGWGEWKGRVLASDEEYERRSDPLSVPLDFIVDGYGRLAAKAAESGAVHLLRIDETLPSRMWELIYTATQGRSYWQKRVHFDVANGFAIWAGTVSDEPINPAIDPLNLRNYFGDEIPKLTSFVLTNDPKSQRIKMNAPATLSGYSVFEHLEPHVTVADSTLSGALIVLRGEVRAANEPLLYSYSQHMGRRGVDQTETPILRVEAEIAKDAPAEKVIEALEERTLPFAGIVSVYVQGDGAATKMDHENKALNNMTFENGHLDLMAVGATADMILTNALGAVGAFAPMAI